MIEVTVMVHLTITTAHRLSRSRSEDSAQVVVSDEAATTLIILLVVIIAF